MTAGFIDSGLEHGKFLSTDISQGSVVIQLNCCKFTIESVGERILKIVNIWRSYGQYYSGLFFY